MVPIRKKVLLGQPNGKIRVFGDYSVAINAQLETHHYPIPLPDLEDLKCGKLVVDMVYFNDNIHCTLHVSISVVLFSPGGGGGGARYKNRNR